MKLKKKESKTTVVMLWAYGLGAASTSNISKNYMISKIAIDNK
jgi:hypothetical protein